MFVRRHTTSLLVLAATGPQVEIFFVSSFGINLSLIPALPRTETIMASSATGEASWDAAAGVWVGDKAVGFEGEVPSPLWIFGYGSLCWRPEQSFKGFDKFDGEVVGWKRLFAQKSMDHRGTPQRPGLVATLISDADLAALGKRSPGDPPSRTYGVAYRVPDDKAEEVLAGLDFREKGGYTRAIVDVFRSSDPSTNEQGIEAINGVTPNDREQVDGRGKVDGTRRAAPTKALLYTATIDNPNFCLSPTMEHAADTIASSVGPSGPNHEYLFLLSEYLHQVGHPDEDLDKLSDMVKSRLDAKA